MPLSMSGGYSWGKNIIQNEKEEGLDKIPRGTKQRVQMVKLLLMAGAVVAARTAHAQQDSPPVFVTVCACSLSKLNKLKRK